MMARNRIDLYSPFGQGHFIWPHRGAYFFQPARSGLGLLRELKTQANTKKTEKHRERRSLVTLKGSRQSPHIAKQ